MVLVCTLQMYNQQCVLRRKNYTIALDTSVYQARTTYDEKGHFKTRLHTRALIQHHPASGASSPGQTEKRICTHNNKKKLTPLLTARAVVTRRGRQTHYRIGPGYTLVFQISPREPRLPNKAERSLCAIMTKKKRKHCEASDK